MGLLQRLGLDDPRTRTKLATAPALAAGAGVPAPSAADTLAGKAVGLANKTNLTNSAYTVQDAIDTNIARSEVAAMIAVLVAHSQGSLPAVQAAVRDANARLARADAHAAKGEYADARRLIAEARKFCVDAQSLADDVAAFFKEIAVITAQTNALKRVLEPEVWNPLITALNQVVADAGKSRADLTASTAALAALGVQIATEVKKLVDGVKARLTRVDAMSAQVKAYFATELADGRKLTGEATAALTGKQWSRCIMALRAAQQKLAPIERGGTRRAKYETVRAATVTAVTALKGLPAVKDRAVELDALVVQADALAARDSMKIEEGIAVLQTAGARAALWSGLAPAIDAYTKERPPADAALAALKSHAAAAKLGEAIGATTQLLAAAAKQAELAKAGKNPAVDWGAALTTLRRAAADLAQAKAMGDGVGTVLTAAKTATADPKNLDALRKGLKDVRDQATAAQAAAHASAATESFKAFKQHADKAQAALDKSNGAVAARELGAAAEALVAAKAIQSEHGQYVTLLAALEARLKKIEALPVAVSIKARIAAVSKALDEARAHDKNHAGADAMAALRRAEDAATAAEQAGADRDKFDKEATRVTGLVGATGDAKLKAELNTLLADAKAQADAFKFDGANAALKKIELKLDTAKVKEMTGKSPPDPGIAALAAKMVANGGAKDVEAMLQALPETGDPRAAAALVQGRYGVAFVHDAAATDKKQELKSIKTIGKMLGTISKDVKDNPSIKGISHVDTTGEPAGAYDIDTGLISLKGRPGKKDQAFGAKETVKIGAVEHKVLPRSLDPDCQPADDKTVDYLSWAVLHEAAHGIDDAHAYMLKHGSDPKMGGWISHGTNVQPIVDVIAAEFGFDKTPAEKKYVLDLIMSVAPVVPPSSGPDWAARKKNIDDWHAFATMEGCYMIQSLCDKWTIKSNKRIYHEAYGRSWVSYDAAARSKGLTGYQFRAPAEWFAELYAGYKTGKLGSRHPAREWLKKLSK